MLNISFSFWRLEFRDIPGRGMYNQPFPNKKTLGTESLMSFLVTFHMCCHNSLLEILSTTYVTPLRKDSYKLVSGFLQTSPHVHFLFADFALSPFAVINDSSEYNNILSPVSPRSNSLNQEGNVLAIPTPYPS